MIEINDKKKCSGCSACANACPRDCLEMQQDSEGFLYPKIDLDICIDCTLCEASCPILKPSTNIDTPIIYAAYNKDEPIRMNSSSGGIFTLIADYVINQGGIVFGACFDDKFELIHSFAETHSELEKLQGSKYVQSTICNTYRQAKKSLDEGRLVLFTGTPCQIGGLFSYLQKSYPNLCTLDLICHGAPSPLVWKKYIEFREQRAGASIKKVSFRNKDSGWKTFSISIEFSNNTNYMMLHQDDHYMRGFLYNLFLRPSCYDCSFKSINRQSDMTLADFWGVQHVFPKMDDDKGISIIMVNSLKGQALFDKIKEELVINNQKVDIGIIERYNSSIVKSATAHKSREDFFKDINRIEFDDLINKYCSVSFGGKIKSFIASVLSKFKCIVKSINQSD